MVVYFTYIQKLPDFPTKHTLHNIMFYVILLYICICSPHLIIISNLAVYCGINFFSVIQPATKKIRHPLRPPNNAWFRWMNLHCIQKISIPVCVWRWRQKFSASKVGRYIPLKSTATTLKKWMKMTKITTLPAACLV